MLLCQELSETLAEDDLRKGRVYLLLCDVCEVSTRLTAQLIVYAYKEGIATTYPQPYDKEDGARQNQYHRKHESFIPATYLWPAMDLQ